MHVWIHIRKRKVRAGEDEDLEDAEGDALIDSERETPAEKRLRIARQLLADMEKQGMHMHGCVHPRFLLTLFVDQSARSRTNMMWIDPSSVAA
jgi:hypothetical protein